MFEKALHDADHRVRLRAVDGLVARGGPESLAPAVTDASREVRVAAAHGLASLGDPLGRPLLTTLAGDEDALVRAAVLEAAGRDRLPAA
ncbi:HEAT repeat domain-containing protein, partial [Actinomadura sp. CNU-125]|uniref:HEAT repeat domain-containing protein n=1 Tax=Actinomadura sp. CNU-125 TaxID=1904961 RepID=UPI002915CC0B